jgi:hypothetical protein
MAVRCYAWRMTARSSRAPAIALLAAASCSMTTVGVIPMRGPFAGETTVQLDADKDVRFWADFDGLYDTRDTARYDVQLIQEGKIVATAVCDPIVAHDNVRVCTTRGWFGGVNENHCRMRCRARVPKSGPTLVRASLTTCCAPKFTTVFAADLTIQQ